MTLNFQIKSHCHKWMCKLKKCFPLSEIEYYQCHLWWPWKNMWSYDKGVNSYHHFSPYCGTELERRCNWNSYGVVQYGEKTVVQWSQSSSTYSWHHLPLAHQYCSSKREGIIFSSFASYWFNYYFADQKSNKTKWEFWSKSLEGQYLLSPLYTQVIDKILQIENLTSLPALCYMA